MKAENLIKDDFYFHLCVYCPLSYKGKNHLWCFDSRIGLIMMSKNQVKKLQRVFIETKKQKKELENENN
jgi:hypothetical protein